MLAPRERQLALPVKVLRPGTCSMCGRLSCPLHTHTAPNTCVLTAHQGLPDCAQTTSSFALRPSCAREPKRKPAWRLVIHAGASLSPFCA